MSKEKTTRIILHVLVWAVFVALPIYSAIRFQMGRDFLVMFYTFTVINAIIFYSNYLFLVPRLFFRKKRYRYYLAVSAFLFCFFFISDFANERVSSFLPANGDLRQPERQTDQRRVPGQPPGRNYRPPMRPRFIIAVPNAHSIGYASSALLMVFLSLGLKVLERQSKIEKMQETMEKEKLNAELALLKNQISPHFFFNTLNNIYSLVSINPDDAQIAIHKLSKLMRYLLYESEHGNTRLSREIEFMSNYIDLMKLRMSEKVLLTIDFPESPDDPFIPPLLFIPFIENAFKHGISYREKSFITINLKSDNNIIIFCCSNSYVKDTVKEAGHTGIGLDNVQKRLSLLFPDKHELSIDKSAGQYEVRLKINLS